MLSPVNEPRIPAVGGQPRLTAAATTTPTSAAIAAPTNLLVPLSQHRLSSYQRWEKITQRHKSLLLAEASVGAIGPLLKLMKSFYKAVSEGGDEAKEARKRQLLHRRILSLPNGFQGEPLLDNRMQIRFFQSQPSKRMFTLGGVNLLTEKSRMEEIHCRYHSVSKVVLPAGAEPVELIRGLSSLMSSFGINAEVHQQKLAFSCDESVWQGLNGQLMMRGQGQRLPAGDFVPIKLAEVHAWQDPKGWLFSTHSERQKLLPQIKGVIAQLTRQLNQVSSLLSQQKQLLEGVKGQLGAAQLESNLLELNNLLTGNTFSQRIRNLMAQANASRNQTQSLLK